VLSPEVALGFLSYYPLKQGLKLASAVVCGVIPSIFILLSIKTRIETILNLRVHHPKPSIFILLSIKTRIETQDTDHIVLLWI